MRRRASGYVRRYGARGAMAGQAVETESLTLPTFRDTIRIISPPWLQRGTAERILYSIGVHCDAFGDALVAGVLYRFPGYYTMQSLATLGRERRIPRGLNESDTNYAARLARFLSDHPYRGGPYALLSQLYIFNRPDNVPIDLVYKTGQVRFHLDVSGNITRDLVSFSPDTNHAKWARWWLFYYTDQWATVEPTPDELAQLKLIPRQWNAAHPLGTIVLFPSGAELWNWPPDRFWNESGVWNTSGVARFYDVEPL